MCHQQRRVRTSTGTRREEETMAKSGLLFFPRTAETVVTAARQMESLGYDLLGLADTPALALDVYVGLTLAALNTSRILLGPCVTNPVSRHPTVTASAVASIDTISGGRAYLGISGGYSGVHNLGLRAASTTSMRHVVPLLRDLMAGKAVAVDGGTVQIAWARRPVPIFLAASGPKGLVIAGQVADAVFVNVGLLPDLVAEAVGHIRRGAEASGRDWRQIEIWVMGVASCAEDAHQAIEEVKGAAVGIASYVLSGNPRDKAIPRGMEEAVARMCRGYSTRQHLQPGTNPNVVLAEELGLMDYLLERFALAGSPEDCRKKAQALEALGIDGFLFSVSASPDLYRDIRMLARALGTGEQPS